MDRGISNQYRGGVGVNPRYNKSYMLFEEAKKIIPGGVTSARHPTKFIFGEYPVYIVRGKGSHIWDVDGNEYICR